MVIDPTITVGNLFQVLAVILAFAGMWLRSEKLLATLSVRVVEAERRLGVHDAKHDANDMWHLNHVTSHTSKSS